MKLRFLFWLIAITLAFSAVMMLLTPQLPQKIRFEKHIYIILFFAFTTLLFHSGLAKSAAAGSKQMIRYYLAGTAIKLFLFVIIIVLYAFINKPSVTSFAFTFLLSYIVFTAFETGYAYRQFGRSAKNSLSEKPGQQVN